MLRAVATLRLFAQARQAAGVERDDIDADSVGELLSIAERRFGPAFAELLGVCRVWVDGESAGPDTLIDASSEVAVLPPVSGGVG